MKSKKLYFIVYTAIFAALICVATSVIYVPIPTGGYAHLGDGLVLLAGFCLPLPYAAMAAGIGSLIADLLAGYAAYAPATFIIKALCAIVACLLYKLLKKLPVVLRLSIASLCAEIIMVGGYLFFEAIVLGLGFGALGGIFGNAMQGVVGSVVGITLYLALKKTRLIPKFNTPDQSSDKTS